MLQQKSYQAKQFGPHLFHSKHSAPDWYIVDAEGHTVGRLATVLKKIISGKHKPTYTENADVGDFVIVINADKVKFTGNKWEEKKYYSYSGYLSGLKEKTAQKMLETKPEEILKKAVWGMLSKTILSERQLAKLKIYAGNTHPHSAQNAQPLPEKYLRKTVLASKKS